MDGMKAPIDLWVPVGPRGVVVASGASRFHFDGTLPTGSGWVGAGGGSREREGEVLAAVLPDPRLWLTWQQPAAGRPSRPAPSQSCCFLAAQSRRLSPTSFIPEPTNLPTPVASRNPSRLAACL